MGSLKTPPRLGQRLPLPPAQKEQAGETQGLAAGDLLEGRYQIEDRLGEGGVGLVYRARQIKLHRRVAVKLLLRATVNEEALKPRFEREALTLAALSHPNIVSLNDYGMVRGQPFIVMELLEGRTLREIIDTEGALPPLRVLGFIRQVLLALAYAHGFGIVHRDLKPANLIVQKLPCVEHLKVLDFGLVKLLPGSYLDNGAQLSRVGFAFGTPAYMSPEHASGAAVDGRADLYAVGVLMFEMLTGKKPFEGELHDVLRHHFQTPVPQMAELRAELAPHADIQAVVECAMAKEFADRYADAEAMLVAVDMCIARINAPAPVKSSATDRAGAISKRLESALRSGAERARPALVRAASQARSQLAVGARKSRSLAALGWRTLRPQLASAQTWLTARARELGPRVADAARRLQAPRPQRLPAPPSAPSSPAQPTLPVPAAPWAQGSMPRPSIASALMAEDVSMIPMRAAPQQAALEQTPSSEEEAMPADATIVDPERFSEALEEHEREQAATRDDEA